MSDEPQFDSAIAEGLDATSTTLGPDRPVPCERWAGPAGCLSGDTVLGINRGGKSYQGTIEYLTAMMAGGRLSKFGRKFDLAIPTAIRSMDEYGIVRLSEVRSAVFSGRKKTFLIKTSEGQSVRATEDHQFLVYHDGLKKWRHLSDLRVGSCLLVDYGKGWEGPRKKPQYRNIYRMDAHPFRSSTSSDGYTLYRVPEHRMVMDAAINGLDFEIFVMMVQAGQVERFQFLDPELVAVHHKDEDSLNNKLDNLVVMTHEEHKKHHAKEGWKNVQAHVGKALVVSIDEHGEEDTYDLTMADSESPNFLANGIVVHNSGKTYSLIERSQREPSWALLTSTTGISAVNLGTITINSTLRYSDVHSMRDAFIQGRLGKELHLVARQYCWIALEEYSMYDAIQLDLLYRGVQEANRFADVAEPLGILLVGDLAQLPPVKGTWCFEAECWPRFAERTVRLDKIWRQDGGPFLDALNHMRYGKGAEAAECLSATSTRWHTQLDSEFDGTTIVDENKKVDRYNQLALDRIKQPTLSLRSHRWGQQRAEWGQNRHGDWGIPLESSFKVGAYVMVLSNMRSPDSPEFMVVNGDCGHVEQWDGKSIGIRLVRTNKLVFICPVVRAVETSVMPDGWKGPSIPSDEDDGAYREYPHYRRKMRRYVLGQIEYYPIRLAYASTVHKSQSLTLDRVQVDFRGWMFKKPAMLYVALSRCRSIEGLRLVGSRDRFITQCRMDERVREWL